MADETKDPNIQELQQTAEIVQKLASNEAAFNEAHAAFIAEDPNKFEAALGRAGIAIEHCHIVCRFFCKKVCIGICRRFCPRPQEGEVDVKEIRAFANAIGPVFQDEKNITTFLEIMEKGDVERWAKEVKRLKLDIFCYQLCIFLCALRCRRRCFKVCPPLPLITRVGSIPVSQIDALGFGHGPSIQPGLVQADNPAGGIGDHPFGGVAELRGIFNMATVTEYLVEVSSTGPGGPYNTIIVGPQGGYNQFPLQPPPPVPPDPPFPGPGWVLFQHFRTRSQSTGADPGWFQVNQLADSDGGRLPTGEKVLMTWPTTLPDGLYYLRLRVRDAAMNVRVSAPQIVKVDNTGPFPLPQPTISLQLEKKDGTRVPLKCGKVRKGDGLIIITIHAFDPNMAGVSVTARGNSGLSVPVVDTLGTPLSRTYNGNIADQGYPVPTEFKWDPWSDPRIVPCCYLIYIEINDRAILNNTYTGGHAAVGWEAIEIGF